MLRFFGELPLALERPDLRIVHACWDAEAIAQVRHAARADDLYHEYRTRVEERIRQSGITDNLAIKLAHQNENSVKLLTSRPECQAPQPFEAMGQLRQEWRVDWWREYDGPMCVFGHYWRIMLPHEVDAEQKFAGVPLNATLGRG